MLLHDAEFGTSNQASSLLGQWKTYRYVVTLRKHFHETFTAIDLVDQRVLLRLMGNVPPHCQHIHSERPDRGGNRTSNASVSHDTNRTPRHHRHIKLFPHSGPLVANHATKI